MEKLIDVVVDTELREKAFVALNALVKSHYTQKDLIISDDVAKTLLGKAETIAFMRLQGVHMQDHANTIRFYDSATALLTLLKADLKESYDNVYTCNAIYGILSDYSMKCMKKEEA